MKNDDEAVDEKDAATKGDLGSLIYVTLHAKSYRNDCLLIFICAHIVCQANNSSLFFKIYDDTVLCLCDFFARYYYFIVKNSSLIYCNCDRTNNLSTKEYYPCHNASHLNIQITLQ